jgi:hypothetical protein
MEEMLTLTRLGISGNLKRTLGSTNPCESMLEIVRRTQRNESWTSGKWRSVGPPPACSRPKSSFRKITGYRDLATTLVIAIERELDRRTPHAPIGEVAVVGTV